MRAGVGWRPTYVELVIYHLAEKTQNEVAANSHVIIDEKYTPISTTQLPAHQSQTSFGYINPLYRCRSAQSICF